MLESVRILFRNIHLKSYSPLIKINEKNVTCLSNLEPCILTPSRTAIIVKRRFPPTLYREGNRPRLRRRTFFYDYVEDTNNRPDPLINVVLSTYVQGVGNRGDIISMKRTAAYDKLLIPGLADYATSEMIEYSRKIKGDVELQEKQLTVSEEGCKKYLQALRLSVVMNQFKEWKLEPWHIRASARKAGVHILSDDSIKLPSKPITGPDLAIEGKEFFVTITINKKFDVKVQCLIHHWTANASERLPFQPEWWLAPPDWLFPEDAELNKENSPPRPPPRPT